MKKISFFIYIPKVAGTIFRKALQPDKSFCMIYDYGAKNLESPHELLNIYTHDLTIVTIDKDVFHAEKYNVLCGHVSYRGYPQVFSEKFLN